jgi:hypothetical protein
LVVSAGLKSEDLARHVEGIDLPSAVAEKAADPDHPADDLVEAPRLITLGIDLPIGSDVHHDATQFKPILVVARCPLRPRKRRVSIAWTVIGSEKISTSGCDG